MPIVDCSEVSDNEVLAIYASEVASVRLYLLALRKLADVGTPMRVSVLHKSIENSEKSFNLRFERYQHHTVAIHVLKLGKDERLIKKTVLRHSFVVLEITQFGRDVLALAEKMQQLV